jgi:hypothetical protein
VFDEDILPRHLYNQEASRLVHSDACLLIAFYFETAEVLTKPARLHAMKYALTACTTWSQWERCVVEGGIDGTHPGHSWREGFVVILFM